MIKFSALILIVLVVLVVVFSTWQLFQGHLEAAFAPFPFLLATYFFLKLRRK